MKPEIIPNAVLRVIMSDDSSGVHKQGPPVRRLVSIQLTPEQLRQLGRKFTGMNNGAPMYECISGCFLEFIDEGGA